MFIPGGGLIQLFMTAFDMGLELMGLTPQSLENRLAQEVPGGARAVQGAQEAMSIIGDARTHGLGYVLQQHLEGINVATLKDALLEQIKTWAQQVLVKKALELIASSLIPGAGIIQAAIKIYETITYVWERFKRIAETVQNFTSALSAIASGDTSGATQFIVKGLVSGLSVAVGFFFKISGLGGIADRIKAFFNGIKSAIDRGIQRLIAFVKSKISRIGNQPSSNNTPPPTGAAANSRQPKTLSVFKTFATRFGVEAQRILRFTDDSTSDDTHDERVARGLDAIETEEAKYKRDNLITIEDARIVASTVKANHGVFKSLQAAENAEKTNVQYNWTASSGTHSGARLRRPPYTDDLEPAPNEGTRSNPFPIDWAKPASANYPVLYFGAARDDYKPQSELASLVGKKDDKGIIVKSYSPHQQNILAGGEQIGLSSQHQTSVDTIVGPLAPTGVSSPGGKKFNSVVEKYGFRSRRDGLDGDHVHEIQFGGQDTLENMWALAIGVNRGAGSTLNQSNIMLANGKVVKVFQLREHVEKSNRKYYFRISSTI